MPRPTTIRTALLLVAILLPAALGSAAPPAFNAAERYSTLAAGYGTNPGSVATGDLNGDNCPDVVAANGTAGGSGASVSVLINIVTGGACTGTLGAPAAVHVATAPQDVRVADLNSDSCSDIIVTTQSNLHRFLNTKTSGVCTATFGNAASQGLLGNYGSGLDVRDLNLDGCPDAVVGYWMNWAYPSKVAVLLADKSGASCSGTFGGRADVDTSSVFNAGRGSQNVTIGDMNADSCPDIVAAARRGWDSYSVILQTKTAGNCTGSFTTGVVYTGTVGCGAQGVAAADFNGDGFTDIAGVNTEGSSCPLDVFFGANGVNGAIGTLRGGADAVQYGTIDGSNPNQVRVADFNGDDKLDLAVAHYSAPSVSVFPGAAGGTFGTRVDVETGLLGTGSPGLATADMDADGQPDVIASVQGGGHSKVAVFVSSYEPPAPGPAPDAGSGSVDGGGPAAVQAGRPTASADAAAGVVRPVGRRNRVSVIQRQRGNRLLAALRDSFEVSVPGRYTLIYVRPDGSRASVRSDTVIGTRTIRRPMSAPVIRITDTSRPLNVTAFLLPRLVKEGLTLRLIRRDPNGSLTGVDLPAVG